jgi:hypothetical protein
MYIAQTRIKDDSRSSVTFVAVCTFVLLLATACRSKNEPNQNVSASPGTVISSTPPFQTKEPDRYRALRTVTIVNSAGETLVTKNLIAKDGDLRRNESGQLAYLEIPEGRFLLLPDEKVYAEITSDDGNEDPVEESGISPETLLNTGAGLTTYQNMGAEVIAGRNSNKYRVVVNASDAGNVSLSETLIWIDETLNMPIRSETTAKDGTRMTMELSDFALEVESRIFQVPENFERISFAELRKRLNVTRGR